MPGVKKSRSAAAEADETMRKTRFVRGKQDAELPRNTREPIAQTNEAAEAAPLESPKNRTHHAARSASVTGTRAARSAGNKPPMRPIPSAHFKPLHSSAGVTWNWNTTWLKLPLRVATL